MAVCYYRNATRADALQQELLEEGLILDEEARDARPDGLGGNRLHNRLENEVLQAIAQQRDAEELLDERID